MSEVSPNEIRDLFYARPRVLVFRKTEGLFGPIPELRFERITPKGANEVLYRAKLTPEEIDWGRRHGISSPWKDAR